MSLMTANVQRRTTTRHWATGLVSVLSGATIAFAANAQSGQLLKIRPEVKLCPEGLPTGSRCLAGRDIVGAYYWLAVPPDWSGTLVVHAHGGPELGAVKAERAEADLKRWSIWIRAGYAYAGSGFRQGGVAVRSAAEDTERVRQIFVAEFGKPKRTVLHGQSWGASVAAKAAELFTHTADARIPYDAVLLSSGVLGGGTQSYNFRLDLRVVYQAICGNHPKPDEPPYPLWQGLPPESALTRAELAGRIDQCTGVRQKDEARSAIQRQNLKTITSVIGIPESALLGHMNWATWHFQDIVFERLAGRNPFDNTSVRYRGGPDDDDLNAKVARYRADPVAVKAFRDDTDLHGRIEVPTLTIHAVNDPVAFVELESAFYDTVARAGNADHLVQVFTNDQDHSYLSDAQYVSAMRALIEWLEHGKKPLARQLAQNCQALGAEFLATQGCRFLPEFKPLELSARVPAR